MTLAEIGIILGLYVVAVSLMIWVMSLFLP